MEEDWGKNASAPRFSLFKSSTPQEEAAKDSFVDIIVYNRWKKSERRLYQRLKAERIAKQIAQEKLQSMDDLTSALDSLTMLKKDNVQDDHNIDELINQVEQLKLKAQQKKTNNSDSEDD